MVFPWNWATLTPRKCPCFTAHPKKTVNTLKSLIDITCRVPEQSCRDYFHQQRMLRASLITWSCTTALVTKNLRRDLRKHHQGIIKYQKSQSYRDQGKTAHVK